MCRSAHAGRGARRCALLTPRAPQAFTLVLAICLSIGSPKPSAVFSVRPQPRPSARGRSPGRWRGAALLCCGEREAPRSASGKHPLGRRSLGERLPWARGECAAPRSARKCVLWAGGARGVCRAGTQSARGAP